jgi:hypothetical protein
VDNKVSIVVGSQDNSKLDLDSLKRKLTDMGRMIETARVNVAGDKEGEVAVERMALKLAALGRKVSSPRIGLEGAARAEVDIAAVGLGLDKLGEKAVTAQAKVGGSGLSGALSRMGKVLGGLGGVAGGALGLGLAGPFAAAGLAAGAFGAVAIPILTKVKTANDALTKAQLQYNQATTKSQRAAALKAEAAATAGLTTQQKGLMDQVEQLGNAWNGLQDEMTPVVTAVAQMGVGILSALMPALEKLIPAGAKVIMAVLAPMEKLFASPFFASFIAQMTTLASQVAPMLGLQLTRLLVVFMQMFMQAGPAAVQVLNQLLPAIVDMASGLIPVVVLVTKVVASVLNWLNANHLLIPALIAVGAAVALASGGLTLIIPAIALVVGGIVHLWQTSQTFRNIVTEVFSVVGRAVLTWAELMLNEYHVVATGFLDMVHFILVGAKAIAQAIDFVMGTHMADSVQTALTNFDKFSKGVDNVFNAAHAKIEGWKTDLANMPKVVAIEGNITDLTNKLNAAKRQLADPHLTATRRAAIEANIGQLELAIARARAELNAINGTVATTYVVTQQLGGHGTVPGGKVAHGGIIGAAAAGGMRSSLTLVGEHGAELVTLPPGAMVHSNPDTQRMLSAAGGGPVQVTVTIDADSFAEAGLSPAQVRNIKAYVRQSGGRGNPGSVQLAFGN